MNHPWESNETFFLLDTETTGLSASKHELMEIAAIRIGAGWEWMDERSWLIRTRQRVPSHITQITGITDALLDEEGRPLAEALDELRDFLGTHPVYAHNARFDQAFLNAAARQTGGVREFELRCSIPVFKKFARGRSKYGLSALAASYRVDAGGGHRALTDCRTLLGCLRRVFFETQIFYPRKAQLPGEEVLLERIKARTPELEALLERADGRNGMAGWCRNG